MRMNKAKIVRIFHEGKACEGFGGEEIRDIETKNMAILCHMHRKFFIQK